MMDPLISVIIPVYNAEAWLVECLDSVLSQNFHEIEVLCVDDGSTDASLNILQRYAEADTRVRVFCNVHGGQSKARNTAIANARGKYLQFTDSDDMLKPGILDSLYRAAEKSQSEVLLFDAEPLFDTPEIEKTIGETYRRYLARNGSYSGVIDGVSLMDAMIKADDYISGICLVFVEREFLLNNRITLPEGIYYEDDVFYFQLFLKARHCIYLPEAGYIYRLRENSTVTAKPDMAHLRSAYICGLSVLSLYAENRERLEDCPGIRKMVIWLQGRARRMYREMKKSLCVINAENAFDEMMLSELSRETFKERCHRLMKAILP